MPDERLSDEQLCEQSQSGRSEAEQILARRYLSLVRALARSYFLAGGDREDLIQEGMIGLLMAIRQFSPDRDTGFSTFAERCIRNRLNNAVKASHRQKHRPLEDYVSLHDEAGSLSYAALCVDGPEDLFLDHEAEREWACKLQCLLTPLENRVLALYLTGMSYQDISERIRKPQKSVDNAVQRIRKKLSPEQNRLLQGEPV